MKPRIVPPSPQALLDQLRRMVLHSDQPSGSGPATEARILDAACALFARSGIKSATMSQIAKDAGISREWLYKRFRNRDAVVVAVLRRELLAFIDGLAERAMRSTEIESAVTDAFVYAIEFLREHALLQRVLRTEPEIVTLRLLEGADDAIVLVVQSLAGYLAVLGGLGAEEAAFVAETLVRMAVTITLNPGGTLDLRDPDRLRRYAGALVPAVIAASHASAPAGSSL